MNGPVSSRPHPSFHRHHRRSPTRHDPAPITSSTDAVRHQRATRRGPVRFHKTDCVRRSEPRWPLRVSRQRTRRQRTLSGVSRNANTPAPRARMSVALHAAASPTFNRAITVNPGGPPRLSDPRSSVRCASSYRPPTPAPSGPSRTPTAPSRTCAAHSTCWCRCRYN